MSLILVSGNRAIAISLLLSISWPRASIVIEGDLAGGVLGAWFELPAGPTLADAVLGDLSDLDRSIRELPVGVRAIIAPVRSLEAAACIRHAEREFFPRLGSLTDHDDEPIDVIVNVAKPTSAGFRLTGVDSAQLVVVTHVETELDQGLASVRLMRLVEWIDVLGLQRTSVAVVLAGSGCFPRGEIAAVLDPVPVHGVDLAGPIWGLLGQCGVGHAFDQRCRQRRIRSVRTALGAISSDIAALASP
jgi:hypothetical protein